MPTRHLASREAGTMALAGAFLASGAVVTQFILMYENRVTPAGDTIIRFFSYFTVLTNSLVAVSLASLSIGGQSLLGRFFGKPGVLTAVTLYITIVGLVYQAILRPLWSPTGLQMITDECLHTVIPLYVIVFWALFDPKDRIPPGRMARWLLYPLLYLGFILLCGSLSGFYPYPFVDVGALGLARVLQNSLGLVAFFMMLAFLFQFAGRQWLRP